MVRAALDDVRALPGWTPLKDDEAQHRRRVREALLKIGTRETMASLQAMGDVSCLQRGTTDAPVPHRLRRTSPPRDDVSMPTARTDNVRNDD